MQIFESNPCRFSLFVVLFWVTLLVSGLSAGQSWCEEAPLRIGVLAIRGPQQCLAS
jgi:hypothetical protein